MGMRMDYSPGTGPRTLDLPGLPPFAPLICYEVVFPELASVPEHPPQWLLVITNNAGSDKARRLVPAFRDTARLRAIEQGLPMMIAGNVGISASIDPYGRVIRHRWGSARRAYSTLSCRSPSPAGRFTDGIRAVVSGCFAFRDGDLDGMATSEPVATGGKNIGRNKNQHVCPDRDRGTLGDAETASIQAGSADDRNW